MNLRLFFLLLLPRNAAIKRRYTEMRSSAANLYSALLDTPTERDLIAGTHVYEEQMRAVRAIGALLTEELLAKDLAKYRTAIAGKNSIAVRNIELDVDQWLKGGGRDSLPAEEFLKLWKLCGKPKLNLRQEAGWIGTSKLFVEFSRGQTLRCFVDLKDPEHPLVRDVDFVYAVSSALRYTPRT